MQFDPRPDSADSEPPIDLPLQDLDQASRADLPVSRGDLFQEPAFSSGGRGFGAGMLVIGLAAGFGGGFIVGQRAVPPPPRASAAEVPRPAPEPAVVPARSFTEAPVAEPPPTVEVQEPEVQRPVSVSPDAARLTASVEAGALQMESRPSGAEIYVDEVRVGATPMTMKNVKPGAHRVRIEMPGLRPWITIVNVEAGVLAHVGASLE